MEERQAAQAALLEEAMGPIIRMGISTYGDRFIADQESYLRSVMGDDFMDTLIDRETSPQTTEEPSPVVTQEEEPAPITTQEEEPDITAVPEEETTPTPAAEEEQATTEAPTPEQQLSDQGVDDLSIALLNSHGSDMLDYVIEQGATTEEEMFFALNEWGQQNNIVMPFDKSAIIYALKTVIDQQP
jgi:hypothetical protein